MELHKFSGLDFLIELPKPSEFELDRILSETFPKFPKFGIHVTDEELRINQTHLAHFLSVTFPKFEIHVTDEELRMEQAHLAHYLRKRPARRLWTGQSKTEDDPDVLKSWAHKFSPSLLAPEKLQMLEEPLQLTDAVAVFPSTIGCGYKCIFEAHVNGFRITTMRLQVDLMFSNIKDSLVLLGMGNKKQVPVMIFCLHRPIMIYGEYVENVQVFLLENDTATVPTVEKLVSFACKVQENHGTCGTRFLKRFQTVENFEIFGVSSSASVRSLSCIINTNIKRGRGSLTHALTRSALVVILNEFPHFVIPLRDVEIVNLRHAGASDEFIIMTVVFENFTHGVYEIHMIPSIFLTDIKRRLNSAMIKFYVNRRQLNWRVLVEDIARYPEEFRKIGGWDSLDLEDDLTLACYQRADPDFKKGQ